MAQNLPEVREVSEKFCRENYFSITLHLGQYHCSAAQ